MTAGLVSSTVKLLFFPEIADIYHFPAVLLVSFIGSIAGTLLTPPDTDEVLMKFYKNVRPWGFWKPIHDKVVKEDPEFEKNKDFGRDVVNVITGIVWQMSLVVLPIYLVIHNFKGVWISLGVIALTMVILKFNWYDRLKYADKGYENK
jgi:hypothetical protein